MCMLYVFKPKKEQLARRVFMLVIKKEKEKLDTIFGFLLLLRQCLI